MLTPPAALAQVRQRRAGSSRGFDRGFSDWGDFNDFNWTILQMQRESIASQEEQPDFQAILASIVLTSDEQVTLPTITPAPALIEASCAG